jgi:hypothetical protein
MKAIARSLLIGLVLIALTRVSMATVPTPKPATSPRAKPASRKGSPSREELVDLVRRAQETAEEARDEARRARADYEALIVQVRKLEAMSRLAEPGLARVEPLDESAPQTQPTAIDARLSRAEEQIEINSAQIKEQAQTKVESDSKFKVKLSGMILFNSYFNSDGIQRTEPLVALIRPQGSEGGTFGSTLRQTIVGLSMSGPRVAGARLSGDIDFDFYGGTIGQVEGDVLGALRIRTATARLDWASTSISAGQETPIISPRNPTSLAAVWYPPLAGAGNLWQWRPLATVEHRFRTGDSGHLIAQGSVLPPFGESYLGVSVKGVPAYEGRVAWRHSLDSERNIEVGFGGHYLRRSLLLNRKENDYIVSGDWLVPLGEKVEVSGEFYHGSAVGLSEQSGGRLDRLYAYNGPIDSPLTQVRGVRSSGGWAQVRVAPKDMLEFNVAFGDEDPNNDDLRFGVANSVSRYRNHVGSANFIYQLRPTFLISLEYRRLWTDYSTGRARTNHLGVAVAYTF